MSDAHTIAARLVTLGKKATELNQNINGLKESLETEFAKLDKVLRERDTLLAALGLAGQAAP